jgi:hydroxymethylpyrimidine/phosphomethylpyrimidine kinase
MKGGHRPGDEVVDLLHDGRDFWEFRAPRIATTSTHGTGCTFAAAIAARLAHRDDVPAAVERAKAYLHAAIAAAFPLGAGHGPVHHFHEWY